MMSLKKLCFLSILFYASSANAIKQFEFDLNGLRVGDKLTEEFFINYCPKKDKGKKEVECKGKQDIDGVQVSVLYLFYDSSLVTVSFSFKSQMYRKLVKAYSKKFSDISHEDIEEPIKLRSGVEYTNKKALWVTTSGNFIIEKYRNSFSNGYAHLDSHEYNSYVATKKSERNDGNSKKIFRELFN